MEDGTPLCRTSGVVYVYGLEFERSLVLIFGLFGKIKYLVDKVHKKSCCVLPDAVHVKPIRLFYLLFDFIF